MLACPILGGLDHEYSLEKIRREARPGRPAISKELRELIREISAANPRWGSPRILGELRTLGIPVAKDRVDDAAVNAA